MFAFWLGEVGEVDFWLVSGSTSSARSTALLVGMFELRRHLSAAAAASDAPDLLARLLPALSRALLAVFGRRGAVASAVCGQPAVRRRALFMTAGGRVCEAWLAEAGGAHDGGHFPHMYLGEVGSRRRALPP